MELIQFIKDWPLALTAIGVILSITNFRANAFVFGVSMLFCSAGLGISMVNLL